MRRVIEFNQNWQFFKGEIDKANIAGTNWEEVNLPHTYNNLDGQDGGSDYYQGCAWYRTVIGQKVLPADTKEAYVRFGAASKKADVYLNGELIGSHEGGFAAFTMKLENLVAGDNELLVRVDNSKELPIYPMQADFTFFGGLYRGASLICFDQETHFDVNYYGIDALRITPNIDGNVRIETKLTAPASSMQLKVALYEGINGDQKISEQIVDMTGEEITFAMKVKEPKLWNGTEDANLYKVVVSLLIDGGASSDEISDHFGFRSYQVDPEKGFYLNGQSYPLHGVCRHQDREDMGWAITEREHDEDMAIIKEVGANTIRLAHYQQAPYFYDLCDENGMVVWAEIPYISAHDPRPEADENLRIQLVELIMQNYNHPSICFWGIENEIGIGGEDQSMYDILSELNAKAKALDPTRLTTVANVGMTTTDSPLFHNSDVATYNEYMGWYEGKPEDHGPFCDKAYEGLKGAVPLGISEYGAEAVMGWHSDEPKVKDYTEEYQALVHEKAIADFNARDYIFATWLWNMFDFAADARDEGGCKGRNNKGLVTYDRKIRKEAFYLYKALWSKEPFVYLCGHRFTKRAGETLALKAYSNQKTVELYANGELKESVHSENGIFNFSAIVQAEGETEYQVKAIADHGEVLTDIVKIEKVEKTPDEYVYKEEKNLSEAVTQWFASIQAENNAKVPHELVIKEGYLSVEDPLQVVYEYPEGYEAIQELVAKPMALINPGMADRMKTGGGMSFQAIWNHISKFFPDDLIYVVNERLNKIKK